MSAYTMRNAETAVDEFLRADGEDLNDGFHLGMTSQRQQETQRALATMFGSRRTGDSVDGGERRPAESAQVEPGSGWVCAVCTLINNGNSRYCAACSEPKT